MTSVASAYLQALRTAPTRVQETPDHADELAWQALWFSGACGREFTTDAGAPALILDFGEWNREAGPDFVHACVRIADRECRGSIEVDLDPSGWEQHGHSTNPDYDNVVLHVVVRHGRRRHFSRTADHKEVPQICLANHPAGSPEWSATATARPGRCVAPLRGMESGRRIDLLATAARRRLLRKGETINRMAAARGLDAALFESVAITLGYKANKLPFQLLAQRVHRRRAAGAEGEALLFGVAGFLDRPEPPDDAARGLAASLWSTWWKHRALHANAIIPRSAWKLAGLRPANHPLRRVAALALVARHWKPLRAALTTTDLPALQHTLGSLQHPFWSFHTTWNSPTSSTPLALVGPDRILDIHANIALPLAFAQGREPAWLDLPAGPANATLRTVCSRLFGAPAPRDLPRKLFVHQGLLQIYRDFCLADHHECSGCPFPALVHRLAS